MATPTDNGSAARAGTRELTSQRVAKFVAQRFFSVSDYVRGECPCGEEWGGV